MEANISNNTTRFAFPNASGGSCVEWFGKNGPGDNLTFETVMTICLNSSQILFSFPGREALTTTLSAIGTLLNSLVVFGVAMLQQHKPLYYQIANLAVSDIITNVVANVMLKLRSTVTFRKYVLLLVTVLHFPVFLSLTGLVLLSVDRYVSVQHAIYYRTTVGSRHTLAAVAGAWVSAALLCFSPMMGWNCYLMAASKELCFLGAVEGSYILFMTVLCAAGVAVVVFTNARVFLALRRRLAAAANGNQQAGRVHINRQQIVLAQKRARSVLVIIAVFLLAWLLFLSWQVTTLVSMYNSWDGMNGIGNLFRFVYIVVLWLVPIVNPLVYAFRLPTLRNAVWDSLKNGGIRLWRYLARKRNVQQNERPATIDAPVVLLSYRSRDCLF
ncbi:adenosine receptor A3-like [Branchiostoma floridae x Branchiostoma belcheri]